MTDREESRDLAALACAWERLANRLARLQMKPEPKPVEVVIDRPRRKALAFTDIQPDDGQP
jgi:hypothetical protein